jgi:putative ABC transport system permease protein
MWRVLRGQARADLSGHRLSSLMMVLVVALATTGIVGGITAQHSAADRWDAVFAQANGAHVTFQFDGTVPADAFASDPAVSEASAPFATALGIRRIFADGSRSDEEFGLATASSVLPAVGRPVVRTGQWLSGAAGEVVLDRSVALEWGLGSGDKVSLAGPAGTSVLSIVGTAADTVDCFYPGCTPGWFGWANDATISELAGTNGLRGEVLQARLGDPDASAAFAAAVQARYGKAVWSQWDWLDTRADVITENQFFGVFLAAFGVVLLIAAGLVIAGAIGGRVVARTRELGVLKAVGMTPRSLTALVLSEQLLLAAIGVGAGFVAGGLVAPRLQLRVAQVLSTTGPSFPLSTLIIASLAVGLLVGVATIVPAWRAGQIPASQAVTRGGAPKNVHTSRLAALAARARLGVAGPAGVTDAFARPVRAMLAVAALGVTTVAVMVTLAFNRTVDRVSASPALVGDPYDVIVVPETAPSAQIDQLLGGSSLVRSWFTATSRRAAVGPHVFQVRALGGDLDHSGFVVRQGRMPSAPNEAVAGYGLLDLLGAHVGETIDVEVQGGTLATTIVGQYSESEDSGRILQLPLSGLRQLEPKAEAGNTFVTAKPGTSRTALASALRAELGSGARVINADVGDADLGPFQAAFLAITFLVLLVGLANLVSGTVLAVKERVRDLAVLRAVGFTPGQIRLSVAVRTATQMIAALVIGVPLGLLTARLMLNGVTRSVGIGPGLASLPTIGAAVASVAALLAVAVVVGLLSARGAVTGEVAEILREE